MPLLCFDWSDFSAQPTTTELRKTLLLHWELSKGTGTRMLLIIVLIWNHHVRFDTVIQQLQKARP